VSACGYLPTLRCHPETLLRGICFTLPCEKKADSSPDKAGFGITVMD
jgi:hypothetical protein